MHGKKTLASLLGNTACPSRWGASRPVKDAKCERLCVRKRCDGFIFALSRGRKGPNAALQFYGSGRLNSSNDEKLQPWIARIPPESWFMVIDEESDIIVATAMGLHGHSI
jgi:hypothetical protein